MVVPTEWHTNPAESKFLRYCPICGCPRAACSKMQHRQVAEGRWQKRRKSRQGWLVTPAELSRKHVPKLPKDIPGRRGSLAKFFHRVYAPTALQGCRPGTAIHYKRAISQLCNFTASDIVVSEVSDWLLERFETWLVGKGYNPESARKYKAYVRAIMRVARPGQFPKLPGKRPHETEAVAAEPDHADLDGGLLNYFLKVYRPQRLVGGKQSTAAMYVYSLRAWARYLGRPPMLTDLEPSAVAGFMRHSLEIGLARKTVNGHRTCILALWRLAYRQQLVTNPPDVAKLKEDKKLPVAWDEHEMGRIVASAMRQPGEIAADGGECPGTLPARLLWPALLRVLFETGLRLGATLALPRAAVDLSTGWLTAAADIQKTRVEQRFLLSPDTVAALKAIWEPPRPLLFPLGDNRRRLYGVFRAILIRAGLSYNRNRSFHAIRRTTASLIAKEAGIDAAARQLGHAATDMTERYIDPRIARSHLDGSRFLPRLDVPSVTER